MSSLLWLVAVLMALRLTAELILSALNRKEVRRHVDTPPPAVTAIMDRATHEKSVAYTLDKSRFGMMTGVFDALVLAVVLFGGVLPPLFAVVSAWGGPGAVWDDALFILLAGLLLGLPALPFEWWEQFRIEQRHGFNKSTQALWWMDRLKGALLTLAIGFPLLWALLALVGGAGEGWWLWGFGLVFGFQVLMLILYPKLILPLFNKLTPLPEGELRTRLLALGDRTGFRAQAIEVIDGSKRSGHSNAFFTGFGRFRRIVLFDTLIAQLTAEELEAVLAHEIGHYRRGHIPRMIALSAVMLLAGFALVQRGVRVSGGRNGAGLPPLRAAERAGDVLVVAADESPVAKARIRGGRLCPRSDGRAGGHAGGTVQTGAEEPLQPHAASLVQRVSLLASDPGGTRTGAGQGQLTTMPAPACGRTPWRGRLFPAVHRLLAVSLLLLATLRAETLTVATYNIENYGSANRMTEVGYRQDYPKPEPAKRALRAVIHGLNADVLVLQEMGGPGHLEELRRDLRSEGLDYPHFALARAADPDRHVAILAKRPLLSVTTHTDLDFSYFGGREVVKRGLLEATVATEAGAVTLFGLHLKSRFTDRSDDPQSALRRAGEATAIRDRILERFPRPAEARFLVLGDCNDGRTSGPLRYLQRRGNTAIATLLSGADSRGEVWSYHFKREETYSRVDHILVSPGLLPAVRGGAAAIYDGEGVAEAADHRPVLVVLTWADSK